MKPALPSRGPFQGCEYSIWLRTIETSIEKSETIASWMMRPSDEVGKTDADEAHDSSFFFEALSKGVNTRFAHVVE